MTDQTLQNYSQNIASILYIEELAVVAMEAITEVFSLSRGTLLLVSREGSCVRLRPIEARGEISEGDGSFQIDSPLTPLFYHKSRPLLSSDPDLLLGLEKAPLNEAQWIQDLGMALYIPIKREGYPPIGFFALGRKDSGEPFSPDEIDFLMSLAAQTVVYLENICLVEGLRQLNDEISDLNVELKRTKRALARQDKAKFDFIQVASYELKTPLTLVRSYADILNSLRPDELSDLAFIRETTQGILNNALRMAEIVESVLDVAKLDAEALSLDLSLISLEDTVKKVLDDLSDVAGGRHLQLSCQLDGLPPIRADEQRLYQAFQQILGNMLKYVTADAQISVTGQLLQKSQESPFIQLVIRDFDLNLVFKSDLGDFRRSAGLSDADKLRFIGGELGLGLTIAKGIVEAHGGTIWLEESDLAGDTESSPGFLFVLLPLDPGFGSEQAAGE